MSESGALTRAALLRRWRRDVLGLSAEEAASRFHIGRSTLSQWESGARGIDLPAVRSVIDASGANGPTLAQLFQRVGSSLAFDADERWEHNFPDRVGPVFAWVRTPLNDRHVDVRVHWGILEWGLAVPGGPTGAFLTGPDGVNNPRVVVDLDPAGWVDFMVGVPPRSLGVPVFDLVPRMSAARLASPLATLWAKYLRRRGHGERVETADFIGMDTSFLDGVLQHAEAEHAPVERVHPIVSDDALNQQASQVRRAREAHGLSQADLAASITELIGRVVSQDAISRLERGRRMADPLLSLAADMALGADGRLAAVPLEAMHGGGDIRFPPWWCGPVWIDVTGPGHMTLTWRPYMKRIEIPSGRVVLYTRCADAANPLSISTEPGDAPVTVGLGRVAGAVDINDNWYPATAADLRLLLEAGDDLALRVFRRSKSTATEFFRRVRRHA